MVRGVNLRANSLLVITTSDSGADPEWAGPAVANYVVQTPGVTVKAVTRTAVASVVSDGR